MLIGAVDVLPSLYVRVLVPETVAAELPAVGTPVVVQQWVAAPPTWCEIRPDPPSEPALQFLDPGERAAIALALSMDAERLRLDDLDGRAAAERRRLRVTGTLGVLADAHLSGLLDFEQAPARLRNTSFRLHPDVESLMRRGLVMEKNRRS